MATFRDDLTADYVRSRLKYNSVTGVFTWKPTANPNWSSRWAGRVAGKRCKTLGYTLIRIDGVAYMAHRLAWLVVKGEWPADQLDHKDGVRSNNRIKNLREASYAANGQNRARYREKFGLVGAQFHANGWSARICVNNKKMYLGRFNTEQEAHEAYLRAKAKLHTFQATPRGAQNASA